jgi:hypothetical protein
MDFEGYCVKCRQKRSIKNGKVEKTKSGRSAAKGSCPVCGTTVTRFSPTPKPASKVVFQTGARNWRPQFNIKP